MLTINTLCFAYGSIRVHINLHKKLELQSAYIQSFVVVIFSRDIMRFLFDGLGLPQKQFICYFICEYKVHIVRLAK